MWSDGRGGVYAASCLCIHCGLLRPPPPHARVMTCLCTVIRRTCTDTPTVKRHQNQTPGQTHTHKHRLRVTSTQLQVVGWGGGVSNRATTSRARRASEGIMSATNSISHQSQPGRPRRVQPFICDLPPICFLFAPISDFQRRRLVLCSLSVVLCCLLYSAIWASRA